MSLKPFPLSPQETFDLAYNAIVKQGIDSSIGSDCVYVGENGKRCAAGHVFAAIRPGFDLASIDDGGGAGARQILRDMGYIHYIGRDEQPQFVRVISRAQSAHDNASCYEDPAAFLPSFKRQMRELALEEGLVVPE